MKNKEVWKTYLAPAILLLGGLLFLVSGVIKYTQVTGYPQTNAMITQIDWEPGVGEESDKYTVYVRYSVGGTTYDRQLDNYKSSYREGQTIPIRYNPKNPETITALNMPATILITAFGGVLLVGGVAALRNSRADSYFSFYYRIILIYLNGV